VFPARPSWSSAVSIRSPDVYPRNQRLHRNYIISVFDEEDNDVTPQPLYQADPGSVQAKASRFFLDEISGGSTSDQTITSASFSMPFSRSVLGSSRFSSQSTIESINEEMEDTFPKRDILFMSCCFPSDVQGKRVAVKEQVTENMLNAVIDIYLSETDCISLLDIPSTSVSVEADNADTITERNKQYAEICKNMVGNEKYVDRSIQTLNDALKHKQVQSDSIVMVDAGTFVSTWEMYDTVSGPEPDESVSDSETKKADIPEAAVDSSRAAEKSVSMGSTTSTGSVTSSMKDVEAFGNSLNAEADLQLIMLSERFQQNLLATERSIVGNVFQPKLAAYRQLLVLDNPDRSLNSEAVEQKTEGSENSPALEYLWTFSCELSRGRSVSSMTWNKKNPDLLAVGYGDSESSDQKPGLVCCWSLKNPTWPERFFHCDSAVTTLDFSTNNPSHLAVGMHNGTIAIYNVQSQNNQTDVINSSECPNKHMDPVWQLKWTLEELSLTGEDKVESLYSVAADGRVSKWFCACLPVDVMKLKRIHDEKKTESVVSALTPGLCFDFHPTDSNIYLVGTWEGLIHKCSCSNSQQFMETYKKHFCPVSCIAWCPLSPSLFLSCSSDWTIQLWKQDQFAPVLGFTSTQKAVCDIKWSPKWATVFGVVNVGQLEIWDLKSSIMDPLIVESAVPPVNMKCLLFASHTDCLVVGDSVGQVTVYLLKNMRIGKGSQVKDKYTLETVIQSFTSVIT
uniref:Dynein axonemal intermediate chain 4 n=1 Tax=Sphaeramia orbicularis TaxID=375764 RepID=A0A673BD44_9TELE